MYKASPISSVSKNDSYLINNDIHKKKNERQLILKNGFWYMYMYSLITSLNQTHV